MAGRRRRHRPDGRPGRLHLGHRRRPGHERAGADRRPGPGGGGHPGGEDTDGCAVDPVVVRSVGPLDVRPRLAARSTGTERIRTRFDSCRAPAARGPAHRRPLPGRRLLRRRRRAGARCPRAGHAGRAGGPGHHPCPLVRRLRPAGAAGHGTDRHGRAGGARAGRSLLPAGPDEHDPDLSRRGAPQPDAAHPRSAAGTRDIPRAGAGVAQCPARPVGRARARPGVEGHGASAAGRRAHRVQRRRATSTPRSTGCRAL